MRPLVSKMYVIYSERFCQSVVGALLVFVHPATQTEITHTQGY